MLIEGEIKEEEVISTISRCNICGQFFDSKKELKEHKDKNHRITDSKLVGLKQLIVIIITITDWLSAVLY
jgi:hypothetical protein